MKIDRIHFYVKDVQSTCELFVKRLGFQIVAANTSNSTHTQVLKSGAICFVISSPLTSASPVAKFLAQHPPGVADIAFIVEDLELVIARARAQGAKILQPIGQNGFLKSAKIAAWGSLSHTLIEMGGKWGKSLSLPRGVQAGSNTKYTLSKSKEFFNRIDHIVLNVAAGELHSAVAWYESIFGFVSQQAFAIQTEHSALHSKVMLHPNKNVTLPINQPASPNSQIQEFLDVNQGAGIQHIALQTTNIVQAIAQIRQKGLQFLPIPSSYYTDLLDRKGFQLSPNELQAIAEQQILVDWEETFPQSILLQTFTQPIFAQPTFFFEIIERRFNAQGFGEGNFRALFQAIEREQMKRGSL